MWKSAVWQVVPSKYDCESNDIGEEDPLQNNQSQSLLQAENAIDNEDADMSGVLNFSAGNDEFEISRMEEFSQDGQHEQDENNDISLSPSPAHTPPPPGIDTQEQTPNLITVPNWETITAVSSIATTAVSSTAEKLSNLDGAENGGGGCEGGNSGIVFGRRADPRNFESESGFLGHIFRTK